jgi:enoyl-CoA hydratase
MTEPSWKNIKVDSVEKVGWITVHRPDKLNALNRETMKEIGAAVDRLIGDPGIRVMVLTGSGDKSFVAGADIEEMSELVPAEAHDYSRFLQSSLTRIEQSPKPILAAVNGFALGGGCELAMACHIRIASENARFSQPEVNLGLIPGAGGTQRLTRLVGVGRALAMILTGEMIDAAEAQRIGLVHRVVPSGSLHGEANSLAATLSQKSPVALARALESVYRGSDMSLHEAMGFEASLFGLCFSTEDMREGTRAFLEKRPPRFPGR